MLVSSDVLMKNVLMTNTYGDVLDDRYYLDVILCQFHLPDNEIIFSIELWCNHENVARILIIRIL